jgi:hypothetical protein
MGAAATQYTKDRFGNSAPTILDWTYHQTAYNWQSDQGVPAVNPQAAGSWYTQWIMQQTPEQSKYTTVLTVFYQDNLRFEDDYVFVPSLRRSLRLSASARCAPNFGSDGIKDDQRYGWNGGVGMFTGKWLRDMKLLTLVTMDTKLPASLANYDGFLGWAKPSWGDWETRDVYVDDIRRSPEFATGYCYGSRVDYIDKQYYTSLAEDIYDAQLQLWKVFVFSTATKNLDNYGEQMWMGGIAYDIWDVQNDHVTLSGTANPKGLRIWWDKEFPERYRDLIKYGTPNGLSMVMR